MGMYNGGLKQTFIAAAEQHEGQTIFFLDGLGLYDWEEGYFQEGLLGLWDADRTFDAEKGDFFTYAQACINSRIAHLHKYQNPWLVDRNILWTLNNGGTAKSLNRRHRNSHDPVSNAQSHFAVSQWRWLYGYILLKDALRNIHCSDAG
ncbi:hypothetical protein EU245_13280 [Lentibacillus lipolyticus]|nr:hypothetical protein EU245_13280 [Lentibacillus lipolyticus]